MGDLIKGGGLIESLGYMPKIDLTSLLHSKMFKTKKARAIYFSQFEKVLKNENEENLKKISGSTSGKVKKIEAKAKEVFL